MISICSTVPECAWIHTHTGITITLGTSPDKTACTDQYSIVFQILNSIIKHILTRIFLPPLHHLLPKFLKQFHVLEWSLFALRHHDLLSKLCSFGSFTRCSIDTNCQDRYVNLCCCWINGCLFQCLPVKSVKLLSLVKYWFLKHWYYAVTQMLCI